MKIFFLCRTGSHTSVLAAGIYLNLIAGKSEFKKKIDLLPGFDELDPKQIGKPFFVGRDKNYNDIYTIGVAKENKLMSKAAGELLTIIGAATKEWRIIDMSPAVSKWTVCGLVLRKIHLYSLAKAFFYLGAKREIPRLHKILSQHKLLNSASA